MSIYSDKVSLTTQWGPRRLCSCVQTQWLSAAAQGHWQLPWGRGEGGGTDVLRPRALGLRSSRMRRELMHSRMFTHSHVYTEPKTHARACTLGCVLLADELGLAQMYSYRHTCVHTNTFPGTLGGSHTRPHMHAPTHSQHAHLHTFTSRSGAHTHSREHSGALTHAHTPTVTVTLCPPHSCSTHTHTHKHSQALILMPTHGHTLTLAGDRHQ